MPELPEVQTVLDTLHAQMGHARIRDVRVCWDRIIQGLSLIHISEPTRRS